MIIPDGWRQLGEDEIVGPWDKLTGDDGKPAPVCNSIGSTPRQMKLGDPSHYGFRIWITKAPTSEPKPEKEWLNPWD